MKVLIAALFALCAAGPAYFAASPPEPDAIMAEYEGFWTAANGARGRVTAQIRPLGQDRYDGFVLLMRSHSPVAAFTFHPASFSGGGVRFAGETHGREAGGDLLARSEARCELRNGRITGTFSGQLGDGTFEADKARRESPTMGAKPPRNGVVLFDGTKASGWETMHWPISEGVLQVGKGDIKTVEKLANYHLHLEFRTPYMPEATGQARGNSGIYLQGKYEIQILDSFGLYPLQDNDCGGIYKVRAPQWNACLPPLQWQTFDITFVDGDSAKNELPTITVAQNGITVIDHAPIPREIAGHGTGGADLASGFLLLQDHGNPVEFRNIWAEPFFTAEKKR